MSLLILLLLKNSAILRGVTLASIITPSLLSRNNIHMVKILTFPPILRNGPLIPTKINKLITNSKLKYNV